ncbi:hypothetical protein ABZY58_11035 [Micromonospora tulbaghiae]|uniref:hypothetical protein n=1 Tax=Micromonospora tulbaghiae TaxID=479978 RepID=UPI0033AF3F6E
MTGRPPTIQVVNFCGDVDDLNDLNLIGPYPDAASRDRDMARLAQLDGVYGSLQFQPSAASPVTASHSCTPDAVADASDLTGVLVALRLILA